MVYTYSSQKSAYPFSQINSDLLGCLRISKGEYKGNRDIERPENSPVDCFQRDGAGRPLGIGNREQGTGNREQEKPRTKRYNQDKGNVSAIK